VEQFKENPNVVNGADIVIETTFQCTSCQEVKGLLQFENNRRVCKACRAIENSERNNDGLESLFGDIERLKDSIQMLTTFVKAIPKDRLIKIISHFHIGRKANDTKAKMIENVVEHFKRLQNPLFCMGNCGFLLQEEFSMCEKCKLSQSSGKEAMKKRMATDMEEFKEKLDDFVSQTESIKEEDGSLYPRKKLLLIAGKLEIHVSQQDKKMDLMAKINVALAEKKKEMTVKPVIEQHKIELNGMMVLAREKDGYINATQMCKAGGKQFNDWKRLETTNALVKVLIAETGIPVSAIDITKGGNDKKNQGSWVHPDLAIQLAQWISPVFAIQVSRWVRELAVAGSVSLGHEKTNHQLLELQTNLKSLEKKHAQILRHRNYHKFMKGPAFYIISDGDGKSVKYKVGIDREDINVRLAQHRSTTPKILLEYLLYTEKCALIETTMMERYESKRKYANHEWIYDTSLEHVITSVQTFISFAGIEATREENIESYNKEVTKENL
jgi:hypothetical protein